MITRFNCVGAPMPSENRQSVETLTGVFEQVAYRARQRRWPAEVVADVAFRSGAAQLMATVGLRETATACSNLARDLERLADLVDGRD